MYFSIPFSKSLQVIHMYICTKVYIGVMLHIHVITMNEEKWEVKRRNIEEYVLTRLGDNTYFLYDIRIERNKEGKLRKLSIRTISIDIDMPPIVFKILGLLVDKGIIKQEELLGR